MLIEIAIGDAYGAGSEFRDLSDLRQYNTLQRYIEHPLGVKAGCYTDDTQMSIAVAEVLLNEEALNAESFSDSFVRCYKRDPRPGYARGFQALLDECENGADLREKISPNSRRNGAMMRSVPLGLIEDKQQVLSVAGTQASVTHNSREGILSSKVVALMAHLILYEKVAIEDLPKLVERETGFSLRSDWNQQVECDAIQTLHAVNTALQSNRSVSKLLLDSVNFGGDVDSVAAVACGLASVCREYTLDFPESLVAGLESGNYGIDFLEELDNALSVQYPALGARLTIQR